MRPGSAAEFVARLRALGVNPQHIDPWLLVGKPQRIACWKLHVSATVGGIDLLFKRVLPRLASQGVHFKIAAGRDAIVQLNAGNLGAAQIGKVVTVYPRNDSEAVALAGELIEHTRGIAGPGIATDLHLGEAVYTRYGAVRPQIEHDRFGEPSELIPDGSGKLIADLRSVPFSCPQGIAIPFPTPTSARPPTRPERRLLAGRYFVTDVLRPGLAGSVLRAIDLRNARGPTAYVLKQARPHCCADERGRDRRARLRHEGAVLARLRGLEGIASAAEYFEDEEVGYLPVTYVPGETLAALVYRSVTGRSWRSVRARVRRRLLDCLTQLVRHLRAAHARGVIHRDVAPANVWIGDDDRVYLLDWECAHLVGSGIPAFHLGTQGFSDRSREARPPARRDDWHACGRVLAFVLTGLDPDAVVHGRPRALALRLARLTELHDAQLVELLARSLADQPARQLDATALLDAIAATARGSRTRRHRSVAPLFMTAARESVLAQGLEMLTARFRAQLERLRLRHSSRAAALLDAHQGIAGLLYVLATAQRAGVVCVSATLAELAARVLTERAPVTPDLPGLVHGRAGRALAIATAVQAGCVAANDELRARLADALAGRLDWPDFTHGAAGQGIAALACARRLGEPALAMTAQACAAYLIRTQNPQGAWTLPQGVRGASGECYTGFAHGAAGVMGFLGRYAAHAGDATANAAWRRAEAWLISRARRGRRGAWQWPRSESLPAPGNWWCHGAPGIALGWLCVAEVQGLAAVAEEHLRGALGAPPPKLRSDSLGQCHGLAGVGEVYLEASRVLGEQCWCERAADIAEVLVAVFRGRSQHPWHYLSSEPAAGVDGLMLGTAGILHFLLRYHDPAAVTSAPLLA